MKEIAERSIGKKIRNSVISVPGHFDELQRQATIDAANIAGLNVLELVNDSSATAIAYSLEKQQEKEARNFLLYDLGGGTCDATIFRFQEGDLKVLAATGESFLGGKEFDKKVSKYCQEEFKDESGIDISGNAKALQRLLRESERAKTILS